jgi:DNA repair photolyase
MNTAQATLPLLPVLPALPIGRRPARLPLSPAGDDGAVEYLDLGVREILNRPEGREIPYAWTLNPYRGCELGCAHCHARYTHGFFGLERWRDFETRIFVKQDAAAALERTLRTRALAGESIALGTAADPYQPAEETFAVTRSLLEVFARVEGLALTLITRSPLILRDLDLLAELDGRHAVTVQMGIPTADDDLAGRLEPGAATPSARLEAVAALAEEGISTRVAVAPLLPGVNEGERALRPLLAAARDAGAFDVVATPLTLAQATRGRFLSWLGEEHPRLLPLYRRLYGRRSRLRQSDRNRLIAPFRRLRLQLGFPYPRPGRG